VGEIVLLGADDSLERRLAKARRMVPGQGQTVVC
jgi:hypothetical protein